VIVINLLEGGHFHYTVQIYSIVAGMIIQALSQGPQPLASYLPSSELKLLSHRISAGFPSPAADYAEEGLDLNSYLVQNKPATFLFTVKGDSMIGAGICDGDKVIVDKALKPKHKDIVVAVVDDEYTIKRLFQSRGRIELQPENPNYEPITFSEGRELQVWGVVVGVVRKYQSNSGRGK
jgi:DNA polymerase V